jgi:hypothetical protein
VRRQYIFAGGIVAAGGAAAGLALQPLLTSACIAGLVTVVLVLRGGHWPITVPFLFIAAAGSDLTTGIQIVGINVPATYVVVSASLVLTILRRVVVSKPRTSSTTVSRWIVLAVVPPVMILVALGVVSGNNPAAIREDAFLALPLFAISAITVLSLDPSEFSTLSTWIVGAGLVGAAKAILIGAGADVTGRSGILQVYSFVNPQFGVERVIVNGGDTIAAIAIPLAVGMLRTARGLRAVFLTASIPIMVLGVTLSYYRSVIGAVAVGAALVLLLRTRHPESRATLLVLQFAAAAAAMLFLFSLTIGQSNLSVGVAAVRRLTGGSDVGSSQLSLRWDDAVAALGRGDLVTILRGRGLGSTFYSPITPNLPQTGYVHMGWAWLLMRGGIGLLALAVGSLALQARRLWLLARSNEADPGASIGAVGAIACFLAMNVFINVFATVEGTAFMGAILGLTVVLRGAALKSAHVERRALHDEPTARPLHPFPRRTHGSQHLTTPQRHHP